MTTITLGRILLTTSAIAMSLGTIISDWSASHIFNPRWPPHAKFHNGQTISMGLCLALATLYYTWTAEDEASVTVAAVFGSLYWVTGLSAWFYPGAKGVDPEFGKGFPQGPIFCAWWACTLGGFLLERRRMAGE